MRKISQKQLEELRKGIVSETVRSLHGLCSATLSGRHDWKMVQRNYSKPVIYYKAKRCSLCKMWNN